MSGCGLPRSPQSCRGHDVPAHFSWNATYDAARVEIAGVSETYRRGSDDGGWVRQSFCPLCGVTVFCEG